MLEIRVQALGREDPLEKEMATHSSTLAWRIPWREECGRLQSMGSQRVGHNSATSLHFPSKYFGLFFRVYSTLSLLLARSHVSHYWQNGGMAPTLPSLSHRHGPGMKKLGFVILTYFFLSLAELTEENIKVLIVFERSMRRHKGFCSCAQRIIHKVDHWHLFKDFYKSVPGWARRSQLETMGGNPIWSLFVRKCLWQRSLLTIGLRNN